MSRHAAWLAGEITQWLKDGLIDETTAQALTKRYPAGSGKSWGFYVLSAMGSMVFGLGIILFFAYNWAGLPKLAKLALIFIALLLAHGFALWLRRKQPLPHNLIEGLHLVGSMMFGAGIWLIAQIYNINEHYPTAFMIWGLGTLAMAWSIPSVIQGLLATVLIVTWAVTETLDFDSVHTAGIGIVALGILPLAWLLRTRLLLLSALTALLGLLMMNIGNYTDFSVVFIISFSIGLLLVAGSWWSASSPFPASADVFRGVGVVVYGVCLFMMTFTTEWMVAERVLPGFSPSDDKESLVSIMQWSILLVTTGVWIALLVPTIRQHLMPQRSITKYLQHVLLFVSLLVLITVNFHGFKIDSHWPILISNLILASHCVLLIIRGTDNLKWPQVALGCISLSVLIFARFNDLFHSLLMRSLAFIVIGVLLFVIGHQYSKRKMRESADG